MVEMEALAAIQAVELSAKLGFDRAVFEGDCQTFMKALINPIQPFATYGLLIQDAQTLANQLSGVRFQYVGRVDLVGGYGSSLFVISWFWVDFMVWWCMGECGCIGECGSTVYRRLWCIGKCGPGLILWVWAMVVWQVWLILGFDFGRCDLILVGFVVGVEIGVVVFGWG
nr:hypothetical protein CFP56_49782 [Quercus suber]